jgi:hypothetical protein
MPIRSHLLAAIFNWASSSVREQRAAKEGEVDDERGRRGRRRKEGEGEIDEEKSASIMLMPLLFLGETAYNSEVALLKRLLARAHETNGKKRLRAAPSADRAARAPAARMDFGGPRYKMDAEEGEVADVPFEVRFSLGNVISVSGAVLFVFCIGKFLLNNGESDVVSTFGFVYAIPALVGGLALKYAELPPVPFDTSPAAEAKRESIGTTIQKKIVSDATRFTYGDAHMEDPLRALKLAPRGMGVPDLKAMSETVTPEGQYCLTMRFFAPNTPYRVWKDRGPRFSRFFGPNVRATLKKYDPARRLVELSLITVADGESDEPLELLEDGSYVPILTAAEEEKAAQAAQDSSSKGDAAVAA